MTSRWSRFPFNKRAEHVPCSAKDRKPKGSSNAKACPHIWRQCGLEPFYQKFVNQLVQLVCRLQLAQSNKESSRNVENNKQDEKKEEPTPREPRFGSGELAILLFGDRG